MVRVFTFFRFYLSLFIVIVLNAIQELSAASTFVSNDIFKTRCFIENKGQFNRFNNGNNRALFGVDNLGDKFYFRSDGYVCDIAVIEKAGEEETGEKEKEERSKIKRAQYTMQWVGANTDARIETEQKTAHYFTYGSADLNSYGYKKIIYKNLYSHIDVVYEVPERGGIKYSVIVYPGGDLSKVRFKFKGNRPQLDGGRLLLHNNVLDYVETIPLTYEADGKTVQCTYIKDDGTYGFTVEQYDKHKTLIVDPWISSVTTLTSTNTNANNKGHDVDFDYAGNLYVYGGGGYEGQSLDCKVAKYDVTGNLLWTFSGTITTPSWSSCNNQGDPGNFVVEKTTGSIYLGQGFNSNGAKVVRLNTMGVYDNFINMSNLSFKEIWDIAINCQTNALIGMGGSTSSNLNIGLINTVSGNTTYSNFTGFGGYQQDIANYTFDNNGELYVILASVSNINVDNRIFRVNANLAAPVWGAATSFNVLRESTNKQYISTFTNTGNGINCLDANGSYLYYYDGFNLKAFNLNTGNAVGSGTTVSGFNPRFQMGIYADECNNIYVGGTSGNLKVYHFDGTNFSALPDLNIGGAAAGKGVYDLRYNSGNNLIYVSGEQFVATVVPTNVCSDTAVLNAQITTTCQGKAYAIVTNHVAGNSYNYTWTDSVSGTILRQVSNISSPTDSVGSLQSGKTYSLTIIKNAACGGAANVLYFRLSGTSSFADSVQLCTGQTYNGMAFFADTLLVDTLTAVGGCDSVVSTTIRILPQISVSVNQMVCYGDTWGGHTWLSDSTLIVTISTGGGCDSVLTTSVQVIPPKSSGKTVQLCPNQAYLGQYYSSDTTLIDTLVAINGCDSVVTTAVQILPRRSSAKTIQLCPGQVYFGHYYSRDTTLKDTLTAVNGCDSIVTTAIQMKPIASSSTTVPLCANQTYLGQSYARDTTLMDTVSTVNGCDSILVTLIQILPLRVTSETVGLCDNQSYMGRYYAADTLLVDTALAVNSCDSIHNTFIHVAPHSVGQQSVSICLGESFLNTIYSHDTTLLRLYQNVNGCDSTVTISLTVLPRPVADAGADKKISLGNSAILNASGGGTYLWNTGDATQSISVSPYTPTTYSVEVTDANGCKDADSIFVDVMQSGFFIPNVFTPNGDGINDVWSWLGHTEAIYYFNARVFNRWGEKVFESNNFTQGWDGTYKGQLLNPGVYVYVINLIWIDGRTENDYKGSLTLIR